MKRYLLAILVSLVSGLNAISALATEAVFTFKAAQRNIRSDATGIWTGAALEGENISIFEYQLRDAGGDFLVSQIWNDQCSPSTCPTKLVRVHSDGRRTVLIEDMMRQIIPPQNNIAGTVTGRAASQDYAHHPFRLSADGKRLINGEFSFDFGGGR